MNTQNLYAQLKSMAVRFEEHTWHNSRGDTFQAALILKPEQKDELEKILKKHGFDMSDSTPSNFICDDLPYFVNANEVVRNVTLKYRKSYKSYIADLDSPNRERVNLYKRRLEQCKNGKLVGVPRLLIEEQIKDEMKGTLRNNILDSIARNKGENHKKFAAKLASSKQCLVTNFLSAPEVLWATCRRDGTTSKTLRLPNGVSVFFSQEDRSRNTGRVAEIVRKSQEKGFIYGEWVLS